VRLLLLAVGRLKDGPERELFQRYMQRSRAAARSVGISDITDIEIEESRARQPEQRKRAEGEALAARLPSGARTLVLDERGPSLSSERWARLVTGSRDGGDAVLCFVLGGADGLSADLLDRHDAVSFGAATLPHQLVRVLVAEQIYRVTTILSGHPYHRA
jgi:23S rRNA (pseudouridine1915-N3)-methyltransferase